MLFWIVVLVVTVILLVNSTWRRVLDYYMIVTDYEIGKEENREKRYIS